MVVLYSLNGSLYYLKFPPTVLRPYYLKFPNVLWPYYLKFFSTILRPYHLKFPNVLQLYYLKIPPCITAIFPLPPLRYNYIRT